MSQRMIDQFLEMVRIDSESGNEARMMQYLLGAVQGIAELITRPGMINVDFANVRQMITRGGGSLMAIGMGEGEDKAGLAAYQALHHPLLEIDSLDLVALGDEDRTPQDLLELTDISGPGIIC